MRIDRKRNMGMWWWGSIFSGGGGEMGMRWVVAVRVGSGEGKVGSENLATTKTCLLTVDGQRAT